MTTRKTILLITLLLVGLLASTQSFPAAAASAQVLADFEGGPPTGWFIFAGGSSVSTPTQVVADSAPLARPDQVGDNEILAADFNVFDFGGFGDDPVITYGASQDWSNFTSFNFWFYGTGSGLAYQAEISDNRSDPNTDTAERFDYTIIDDTPGWRFINIPFADFTRATDFQPGGAPDDGFTLTEIWAWAIVLPNGADVVYFDDFSLGKQIVDDFESGLPSGVDGDGNDIGFYTFQDPDSTVAISTTDAPPASVPGSVGVNTVLQVDTNVNGSGGFAGVTHAFENAALDTWTPQDWSRYVGMSFWLYGNNTGSILFIDVQDNRAPGTTGDTAERYSIDIIDDFSGWQYIEIPFSSLNRKEIGNGAPFDGLNLTEVHGWAFGVFNAGQAFTNYIDDVALYGNADVPELTLGFTVNNFDINEGETGNITVKLSRPMGDDDPAQVSVDYYAETIVPRPGFDYIQPAAGTLTFVNGGPSELSFPIETLDDDKYEDTERVILRLTNPVDVAPGFIMQASASIINDDPFNPLLIDDYELGADLWDSDETLTLSASEIISGDPKALPGQGAYETVLQAAPVAGVSPMAQKEAVLADLSALLPAGNNKATQRIQKAIGDIEGSLNPDYWTNAYYLDDPDGKKAFDREQKAVQTLLQVVKSGVAEAADVQAAIEQLVAVDATLAQIAMTQAEVNNGRSGNLAQAYVEMTRGDNAAAAGNYATAISRYRKAWLSAVKAVRGMTLADPSFGRDFALGKDWSLSDGLTFMYYGQGTGDAITLELLDNRAPDPGPSGWSMVWNDEFNEPAGSPPNPENWGYEIGDGIVNGIPGWGNSELQYYTDSPENVATDGNGNLVVTIKEADGSLTCYYGPCEYTSARLISWHKAEFAYGRIESRVLVPDGEDGLWPAFWSLGTDIDLVGWPQTGEIDIMEYVSRIPDEIFGTIHGPGYAGGEAFGNTYPFPGGVAGSYHTFTIDWQPDLIEWYVDGILYHTATPDDVAPNEWVFNDPVFLLLNLAIGGNFGGAVSEDLTFPQAMAVDYVRVYQGPDTAERFEATFVDDFTGWQEVFVPFDALTRSADQPAGAPNDGLTLTDVWGYGFKLPVNSATATAMVDQVRLVAPSAVTVMNSNDSGSGSLREAVNLVAPDGMVTFDPGLANSTINLTSGPVVLNKSITIDGTDAPGLTLSGGNVDRILVVEQSGVATVSNLTITEGFGWQLAGGVLNNGTLTLDHVTVTGNTMATDAGDFWQGGGGIYNGDGATLNLIDSTVSNNTSGWTGGGVYSFFNTTTNIIRSTISDNVALDVAGGMRILSSGEIVNSTLSGNTSTAWHGGGLFLTDGVMTVLNSTVENNNAPGGTTGGLFVGTFGPSSATLIIQNSIVANNGDFGCFLAPFGTGAVALISDGNNVLTDGTCGPIGSDQIVADPLVGALAANGGPTLTHALLAGSPAIDAANTAVCPATDQRGVARDVACDIGAFELVP